MKELIVNLACTGVIPTRAMSPHVPLQHAEIVADVAACLDLGVQMFHLHARDADGLQVSDPEPYGRLIEAIRRLILRSYAASDGGGKAHDPKRFHTKKKTCHAAPDRR